MPTTELAAKPEKYTQTFNPDGSVELRSIAKIIEDLSKPISPRHLETKRQGGTDLTFISWYYAVQYLDFYAPGWSSDITHEETAGGVIVFRVSLSIPCLEGVVSRSATGQEKEAVKAYGDSSSNAESMAFRRAAAKFGLGLYLYYTKEA